MFKITIICIGKIKEEYIKNGILEYEKRIKKFCNFKIIEIKEELFNDNSKEQINKALEKEYLSVKNIINNSKENDKTFNILLDINGEMISTLELEKKINYLKIYGINSINFIIGSSHGVFDKMNKIVNMKLSFSKFTFPHQLFRLILIEQIYRILKISNNEKYHK